MLSQKLEEFSPVFIIPQEMLPVSWYLAVCLYVPPGTLPSFASSRVVVTFKLLAMYSSHTIYVYIYIYIYIYIYRQNNKVYVNDRLTVEGSERIRCCHVNY